MSEGDIRLLSDEIGPDEIHASLTMQVATTRDGQPWVASVYFVMYEGNFYWLSFPERRHSEELLVNPRASIAIVVQAVQPVVGLQAEGDVTLIDDIDEARSVLELYVHKYDQGGHFMRHLETGTNKHKLYRFTPRRVMVFNERDAHPQGVPSPREVVMT